MYASLKEVTGGDILPAQYIFIGVYVVNLAVVLAIYVRAKVVPPWVLPMLCLSKRVHSIFVLRLFNDCFAMVTPPPHHHRLLALCFVFQSV